MSELKLRPPKEFALLMRARRLGIRWRLASRCAAPTALGKVDEIAASPGTRAKARFRMCVRIAALRRGIRSANVALESVAPRSEGEPAQTSGPLAIRSAHTPRQLKRQRASGMICAAPTALMRFGSCLPSAYALG